MRLLTRFGARSALRSSTCRQPRTVSGRPSIPPLEQARRPKERHARAYRSEVRPVIFSVPILGRHRFSPIAGAAQNMFSSHWSRLVAEHRPNVRFGSKTDISPSPDDVRFTPESGHELSVPRWRNVIFVDPSEISAFIAAKC